MSERKIIRASNGLNEQINSIVEAMQLAEPFLEPGTVDSAANVIARSQSRRELSAEHVVVGLFGATGSGKSTLFNALVGQEIASTGVIRPTTTQTVAAIWEQEGANELLDWLEVDTRHPITEPRAQNDSFKRSFDSGLLLLDLPDMDSMATDHHDISTRLVGQVDYLIWVLDPQKYADASIHHGYFNSLRTQQGNLLIVLNQIDRVAEADRKPVIESLRQVLSISGLENLPILGASAITGEGVAELRAKLVTVSKNKALSTRRLRADVDQVILKLQEECIVEKADLPDKLDQAELEQAIAKAHGSEYIADAVETSYLLRGAARTGWPVTSWLVRLRNDPLKRMNLGRPHEDPELALTSRPELSIAESASIDHSINRFVGTASDELPESWKEPLRETVYARTGLLHDGIDAAIASTPLGVERSSWWWPVVKVLQWLALLSALVGALWLAAYPVAGYFQFQLPEAPRAEGIALPTLMVIIGLLLGIILGLACSFINRLVAKLKRRKALRNIERSVSQLVRQAIVEPVDQHLDTYNSYAALIASAAKKAD